MNLKEDYFLSSFYWQIFLRFNDVKLKQAYISFFVNCVKFNLIHLNFDILLTWSQYLILK